MATKEQFIDWKNHSVTQEVFAEIRALIEEGRNELEYNTDYVQHDMVRGKLRAWRDILEITVGETHD